MKQIQTEVLVIGGGATGCGVVRDLAMRGFRSVLVEKGDLTHGTTGRYHGLLHSGARYVVTDPAAARECIQENRILRKILRPCIEDTGGFFVLTEVDDPAYINPFLDGCRKAGIPVEEVGISEMLKAEPALSPRISRCFRVPDASADSFLSADLNAESARQEGAQILKYHQVGDLIVSGQRVVGVRCHDLALDEEVQIFADFVINASGAWAGKIAILAGLNVDILPGKGTMVALSHRIVNTVINRCKLPGDGDILVPAHTVAVIGTTDVPVANPDHFSIEPWEVDLLVKEGEHIIPGFQQMRFLRAWAGVRPLYRDSDVGGTRKLSRSFILLDHEKLAGISGMLTISGGKWTTYRKMAEATVDLACQKLGVSRLCRTHLEPLPTKVDKFKTIPSKAFSPGAKLAEIEESKSYGSLICECELATEADVTTAILKNSAQTIDDIRRDIRLGMGPCQGGFCTYRAAGLIHRLCGPSVERTNVMLRDFLQERWKGLVPILWGQQLHQERLDELIYLNILNTDHLPGPKQGPLSPKMYAQPEEQPQPDVTPPPPLKHNHRKMEAQGKNLAAERHSESSNPEIDVLVIGAGLAGLSAALSTAQRGQKIRLITQGWGSLYWLPGCVDVLGYSPQDNHLLVSSPLRELKRAFTNQPDHPYTRLGEDTLSQALVVLQDVCSKAGYPLHGSLEKNWLLPSGLGTVRPTCLAPETMLAGDLHTRDPILVVGIKGYVDFYPEWIADNLSTQGVPARSILLDMPELGQHKFLSARVLANLCENPDFMESFAKCIQTAISKIIGFSPRRLGLPAILGYGSTIKIHYMLQERIGLPVFEIPSLPPSIPGIRLNQILVKSIEDLGGEVFTGMKVQGSEIENGTAVRVWSEAAARRKMHHARVCILATGGILGGGLLARQNGLLEEPIFNLPLVTSGSQDTWFQQDFLAPNGHALFRAGVKTNAEFNPINSDGKCVTKQLYAVGGLLAGNDPLQTRSLEGEALLSGWWVGSRI